MNKLNRRNFLKKAGALAIAVGVALIVAACTGTTAAPTTAPVASTAGATAVPAATAAVAATTVPEIGGDFNFLTWYGQDWTDKMKAEIGQVYPKLKLNIQNNMGVSDYLQAQKTRFLAGAGVMDVTELRSESIPGYIQAGYLTDLTDLVKDFQGNYIEGKSDRCLSNGRLYCVPNGLAAIGMFYNKKMFAERGLSEPKTWDDLIKICEAFKKDGIYCFADSGVASWPMEQTVYPFITKVFADDPQMFDKLAAGTAKYTDPVWVDTFKQIDAFYKAGYIDPNSPGYDLDAYTAQFLTGKVPMLAQGSYYNGRVKTFPIDDLGVFPVPLPGTDKTVVPADVVSYLAINKSTSQVAPSVAFLKWFADPNAGGTFYARTLGFGPAVKGAKVDDPLLANWAPLYNLPSIPFWHSTQGAAANKELLSSLALLFAQKITPEEMAANIQKAQEEQK